MAKFDKSVLAKYGITRHKQPWKRLSRLFMIQTSLERRIGAAGRNEQQGLGCGKK